MTKPNQKHDDLIRTIKVIRTWASVPGALVPADVIKLCDKVLASEDAK
jgi:hypothetical protein